MPSENVQPTTQRTAKKKSRLSFITVILPLLPLIFYLFFHFADSGEKAAIEAAEKWVNQQVYSSLGILPKEFKSVVIYKDGQTRLIEVKFELLDENWDGTYCVHTDQKYVLGGTNMMGGGYSFKSHLEEAKAIFGL